MIYYIVRRVLYAIPILIGVNVLTFTLFFVVNSPDDVARMNLGDRHVTSEQIEQWKQLRGYDKPLFFNLEAQAWQQLTDTIFYNESIRLFWFDFGVSDNGRNIAYDIRQRMMPSLAIAIPTLAIGLLVNISFALIMVFFRATAIDFVAVFLCIVMMSISSLFYIIAGQFVFAKTLLLLPISGYEEGWKALQFLILPILVGVISGIGAGSRWYRTICLEESGQDYVRMARAKGLSESAVLVRHILRNALIPILTGVVVILPLLFIGSLITESFFSIPGLGSYTVDAIVNQDFAIIRSIVFLGAVLYIIGLLLTDISYTIADPRIRLN